MKDEKDAKETEAPKDAKKTVAVARPDLKEKTAKQKSRNDSQVKEHHEEDTGKETTDKENFAEERKKEAEHVEKETAQKAAGIKASDMVGSRLKAIDGIVPRGRNFVGTVISDRMAKTVTVEWIRKHYDSKYERYEKRRTRVKAHNPASINAKQGDIVMISETRPLSKTKNFIVTKVFKE